MSRFYIIGMGSSPDLATVRGVEAIKRSDLVIVESESDVAAWSQYIGRKPVVYAPHKARLFYGTDPAKLSDPEQKELALKNDAIRKDLVARIEAAVVAGKIVAYLQWGDAMVFGNLYLLEMLPPEIPTEVIPGVGALQAGSAALQRSAVYGWDTSGVILTMGDWPGRTDTNCSLMRAGSSMVFYTMGLKYPELFAQLAEAYPSDTPVAVVSHAGDSSREEILRSTVGSFLRDIDWSNLPVESHMLFVGKFLSVGQARKDGICNGRSFIERDKATTCLSPPAATEA